jgi:hypothetical protein
VLRDLIVGILGHRIGEEFADGPAVTGLRPGRLIEPASARSPLSHRTARYDTIT